MYATSTRSTKSIDAKAFLQAIWAALILAAIIAGGAVIAQPSQGSTSVPAGAAVDDRQLDGAAFRNPAVVDDRQLDGAAFRNPPVVDDRQLDGAAFRNPAPGSAGPGNDSAVGTGHR